MSEVTAAILPIPAIKITERHTAQLAVDMVRGWDVAEPFFQAGGEKIALAELLEYNCDMHSSECHWFNLIVQGSIKYRLGHDTFVAEPGDLMYVLIRRIIDARLNQDVYSVRCAVENSHMLVTLLKRELHQSSNEWSSGRMGQLTGLLDQIRTNPQPDWNRSTMAKAVNMSERNLSRVFKRVFNMPPIRMVTSIRMDLATRLLLDSARPLAAIASAVGYESAFSFARLFKKHVGVSPGQYRHLSAESGVS